MDETNDVFDEGVVARDLPGCGLERGDVGTLLDLLPVSEADGDPGCVLEIFNAWGESLRVVVVPCSAVQPLGRETVWSAPTIRDAG